MDERIVGDREEIDGDQEVRQWLQHIEGPGVSFAVLSIRFGTQGLNKFLCPAAAAGFAQTVR